MLDALNTCKRVVKKQHTLKMHSHRTLYIHRHIYEREHAGHSNSRTHCISVTYVDITETASEWLNNKNTFATNKMIVKYQKSLIITTRYSATVVGDVMDIGKVLGFSYLVEVLGGMKAFVVEGLDT